MGDLNTRATFGRVFSIEVGIAIAVFVVICAAMTVALLRARRRRKPTGAPSHPRTEAAAIGLVALVAAFLVTLSISANSSPASPRPSLRVSITAFQWCWRFSYTGTNVSVTGQCTNGDIPTLVLPTDRVVRIDLTSADVVHSMWIPYLRFKLQAFPHHLNSFDTTISTAGTFAGRCAEFCGIYHYAMDFTLKTLPPAQFQAWLHTQESAGR